MIDLDNEEHCGALARACESLRESNKTTQGNGLMAEALFALSDPAQAAELIRALVERAGCTIAKVWAHDMRSGDERGGQWVMAAAPTLYRAFEMPKVPALITRLLAIAPNAGADAVLAALRGE